MSQQINLYSPIFRKQPKVFSAATMLQGLGLIVLVVTVFYYYMAAQSSLLELRAAESGQQLKSELERLKVYGARESPAERLKALAERKKALEDTLTSRGLTLDALKSGSFGRTEGYSERLYALGRVSLDGVWLTRISFSPHAGELSLAGRALRAELVPAYLERLRADKVLRSEAFTVLEVTRPAPAADGTPASTSLVEFTLFPGEPPGRAK